MLCEVPTPNGSHPNSNRYASELRVEYAHFHTLPRLLDDAMKCRVLRETGVSYTRAMVFVDLSRHFSMHPEQLETVALAKDDGGNAFFGAFPCAQFRGSLQRQRHGDETNRSHSTEPVARATPQWRRNHSKEASAVCDPAQQCLPNSKTSERTRHWRDHHLHHSMGALSGTLHIEGSPSRNWKHVETKLENQSWKYLPQKKSHYLLHCEYQTPPTTTRTEEEGTSRTREHETRTAPWDLLLSYTLYTPTGRCNHSRTRIHRDAVHTRETRSNTKIDRRLSSATFRIYKDMINTFISEDDDWRIESNRPEMREKRENERDFLRILRGESTNTTVFGCSLPQLPFQQERNRGNTHENRSEVDSSLRSTSRIRSLSCILFWQKKERQANERDTYEKKKRKEIRKEMRWMDHKTSCPKAKARWGWSRGGKRTRKIGRRRVDTHTNTKQERFFFLHPCKTRPLRGTHTERIQNTPSRFGS